MSPRACEKSEATSESTVKLIVWIDARSVDLAGALSRAIRSKFDCAPPIIPTCRGPAEWHDKIIEELTNGAEPAPAEGPVNLEEEAESLWIIIEDIQEEGFTDSGRRNGEQASSLRYRPCVDELKQTLGPDSFLKKYSAFFPPIIFFGTFDMPESLPKRMEELNHDQKDLGAALFEHCLNVLYIRDLRRKVVDFAVSFW
ncbi:MAG: hypothetical protein HQ592_16055, partial [Planctomycetes bacterium]|nr:hypothetical protein [Planctomycetota bacterium]